MTIGELRALPVGRGHIGELRYLPVGVAPTRGPGRGRVGLNFIYNMSFICCFRKSAVFSSLIFQFTAYCDQWDSIVIV